MLIKKYYLWWLETDTPVEALPADVKVALLKKADVSIDVMSEVIVPIEQEKNINGN